MPLHGVNKGRAPRFTAHVPTASLVDAGTPPHHDSPLCAADAALYMLLCMMSCKHLPHEGQMLLCFGQSECFMVFHADTSAERMDERRSACEYV